jgi:membrane-bound lytic murein transglycosylase D
MGLKEPNSKLFQAGFRFVLTLLLSGAAAGTTWAGFVTSSGQPLPAPTSEVSLNPIHPTDSRTPGTPAPEGAHLNEGTGSPFQQEDGYVSVPDPSSSIPDAEGNGLQAEDNSFDSEDDSSVETEEEDETTYDVPIVLNESVEDYITYFQTSLRDKFSLWLARSGRYLPRMREIFKQYGLPEDLVYVALIESGFNPYAYSRARAVGPWQFIIGTGRLYGLRIDNWVDERRDPIKSTHAAGRHLKDLYARFGSWPLALASYNAGERKIQKAILKTKTDDYWDIRNSRHIRHETKGYVPKFMAATIIAKNPERYGFTLEYHEPFAFDEVTVSGSASLTVIAQAAGISYQDLKELNPELRTEITPPYVSEYHLRLPEGTRETFEANYAQIPEEKRLVGSHYKIRLGDTLSHIAKRFGITVGILREINRIESDRTLKPGETLFIPKLSVKKAAPRKPSIKVASADLTDPNKIVYRVKAGDTLWDIAQSFKISLGELKRLNGFGPRSLIRPGDLLLIGYKSKTS